MLGPEQGARLEAALRLDSLCVNDSAPPPLIPTSQQREQADPRRSAGSIAARHDSRAVLVPEQRLREVQDQVRSRAMTVPLLRVSIAEAPDVRWSSAGDTLMREA